MIKKSFKRLIKRFKKPNQKTIDKILINMGITESDTNYGKLKMDMCNLIGKKAREKHFSQFFQQLSNLLYQKIHQELSKRDKLLRIQDERLQELSEQLMKNREQLVSEVIMNVFSPQVFTIIDLPIYEILNLLKEGEVSYKTLQRILNLKNGELIWRLNYLKDSSFIKVHYNNNSTIYRLSDTGGSILNKKEVEYKKMINLIVVDKVHRLSLNAVAGDELMAKTLESWLKSYRGRTHMGTIHKLFKEFDDPKKVSQCFFGVREMGTTHEKHIGVKISDHQASGELLLSELKNFLLNNKTVSNNRASCFQQQKIKISN